MGEGIQYVRKDRVSETTRNKQSVPCHSFITYLGVPDTEKKELKSK